MIFLLSAWWVEDRVQFTSYLPPVGRKDYILPVINKAAENIFMRIILIISLE